MKLMTKELEKEFEKYPIGSQDGNPSEAIVIAKYFNPIGAGYWFITEGSKMDNGDWEMYGFAHLGYDDCAELGYVLLSDLENIRLPYGMGIERDLYLKKGITLKDALEECGLKVPSYWNESESSLEED